METWKDIPKYEGIYLISSLGRVKSLRCGREKILKQSVNAKDKKKCLSLYDSGKNITYETHRLVAEVFVPNPKRNPQVFHKNRNKNDNRAENLEWVEYNYEKYKNQSLNVSLSQ